MTSLLLCKTKGRKLHLTADDELSLCNARVDHLVAGPPEEHIDELCKNCLDLWNKGAGCEPRDSR